MDSVPSNLSSGQSYTKAVLRNEGAEALETAERMDEALSAMANPDVRTHPLEEFGIELVPPNGDCLFGWTPSTWQAARPNVAWRLT